MWKRLFGGARGARGTPAAMPAADADYEARIRNELAHHSAQMDGRESDTEVVRLMPTVSAFDHAMSFYSPHIATKMPHVDVQKYMTDAQQRAGRPLRILSLGCGTGDWEFDFARREAGRLRFDLLDIDEALMSAAARLAREQGVAVATRVADVNRVELEAGCYDFVLCRSSLHHFLDLERVFAQVEQTLTRQGEFIVIGEWIGRNGLQIFPETEKVAQQIFSGLPARLRKNCYTSEIDDSLPNIDHSVNSFEAVRSEDIMPLLLKWFQPREYILVDGMISLLLDFRYGPNYRLEDPEDLRIVESIARRDVDLVLSGQIRPTTMFGIYGKQGLAKRVYRRLSRDV